MELDVEPAAAEITVLFPCLNEARTVGLCVSKALVICRAESIAAEELVADNGSSDGSPAVARLAGARVVEVAQRGYGAALRAGIEAARGSYVVMADADDSYQPTDLPSFLAQVRAGAERARGSRFTR